MEQNSRSIEDLIEAVKPWLTVKSAGGHEIVRLAYFGRLAWLAFEHPGWHISAGRIIPLNTGVLAGLDDSEDRQVRPLTSYVVSAAVLNESGQVVTSAFSDEYRAWDYDVLSNEDNLSWVDRAMREAACRALENIGIDLNVLTGRVLAAGRGSLLDRLGEYRGELSLQPAKRDPREPAGYAPSQLAPDDISDCGDTTRHIIKTEWSRLHEMAPNVAGSSFDFYIKDRVSPHGVGIFEMNDIASVRQVWANILSDAADAAR